MAKPGEVTQNWWLPMREGKVLGRLASGIAMVLMGKHRPEYTPHVDTGDFVIVTNVEKIVLTGNKRPQKKYTWYTGYPGLRSETLGRRLEERPHRYSATPYDACSPRTSWGAKCSPSSRSSSGPTIIIKPNSRSRSNWVWE